MRLTTMGGTCYDGIDVVWIASVWNSVASNDTLCVLDLRTPLFNAASNGHVETMQHLIKSGANVAATSANGRTALHMYVWVILRV